MRRRDKIKNIQKANILAEQRYLQSKGLIIEATLSNQEQRILNDILNEINNINEADFNSVINKVKNYAKKGLLTTGILTALLATPNITQAQSNEIKKAAEIETVDQTNQKMDINQLLGIMEKNPKTILDKLQQNDQETINMVKDAFIDSNTGKVNRNADTAFENWVMNYFIKKGQATVTSGDEKATPELKKGIQLKDFKHYDQIADENKGITLVTAYSYQNDDDKTIKQLRRVVQDVYYDADWN
jgi:hypothetical protein